MITIKTDDFTGGKTVNTHLVKIEEFISVETYSEVFFFV